MSAITSECARCGQAAFVAADGIRCYCTGRLSAVEHHALDAFIRQRQDDYRRLRRRARAYTEEEAHP
ncbi:MAG: hypothetical protein GEU83_12050 [Pseudonocardiaceae bacterium]|nr:hypothetical protein [Pseudonocardiaceae bacterium]